MKAKPALVEAGTAWSAQHRYRDLHMPRRLRTVLSRLVRRDLSHHMRLRAKLSERLKWMPWLLSWFDKQASTFLYLLK